MHPVAPWYVHFMPKKRRKSDYHQSIDGEWQYPFMRVPSFVSCCGCGLVHRHIIQITPDDSLTRDARTKKWRRGRRVRIKVSRDNRKTAQKRRGMAKRKELYKTSDGWYVAAFPINVRKIRKQRKSRK